MEVDDVDRIPYLHSDEGNECHHAPADIVSCCLEGDEEGTWGLQNWNAKSLHVTFLQDGAETDPNHPCVDFLQTPDYLEETLICFQSFHS